MTDFKWNNKNSDAAVLFAEGYTTDEVAAIVGCGVRTLGRWKAAAIFRAEVDRLSCMLGVASKAHRLRIAQRVVRNLKAETEKPTTEKDLLDWLKYAQTETDGIRLDVASLVSDLLASDTTGRRGGDTTDSSEEDGGGDNHTGAG